MNWWIIYFAVMAIAVVFAAVLTPICRSLAWKWNVLDKPLAEGHKLHSNATPVLGGLAMVSAWALVIIIGVVIMHLAPEILPEKLQTAARGIRSVIDQVYVIVGGALGMFLIGVADDKRPMSAKLKLSLQIAIIAVVAKWGVQITLFSANAYLQWLLSFSWMMVILNAINFYDNMDGLLSGVAAICAFIFMLAAATMGQYLVAILAAVTCGVAIGFYFFNRNPASIFMGDGGSHFLGYMLGVIGAMVTYYKGSMVAHEPNVIAPFLVPFMVLALPLFDLGAVVVIRLRNNKPIYIGDHNHISHRFVRMGFSRKHAVRLIHLLSFVIGISGIALLHANITAAAMLLAQTAALFIFLTILHSRQKISGKSNE